MMERICGGGRREERGDCSSEMIVVVQLSSASFRLPLIWAVVWSLAAMVTLSRLPRESHGESASSYYESLLVEYSQ